MTRFFAHISLDKPAEYVIKVQGRLIVDLSNWFDGHSSYTVEPGPPGEAITCLTGTVADQAALHGLIGHIRDLGLVLLYVNCLSAHDADNVVSKSDARRSHE